MVGCINYKVLNADGDFKISLTSKLIICFMDGFTSGMKSQTIACLLGESEHM